MTDQTITIRAAAPEDAPALLAIYGPYVAETAITFEYDIPSEEEFRRRIRSVLSKYPYLAAERNGEILGYAYAGPFKERAAYAWSAEASIYVARDKKGLGIGGALYRTLETVLAAQGILNLYACIACPQEEDEYLTGDSVAFHTHMGYRLAGRFRQCGCKFGRWYDMVWMEKQLGSHTPGQAPPKNFDQVRHTLGL